MWRPTDVVPQHRRRATLVWGGLILAAIAYTAWQIGVMVVKRRNPSTSIALSNDNFQFPEVTICFYDGFGCGFVDKSTDVCTATAKNFSYAHLVDYSSSSSSSSSYYFISGAFIYPKESEYSHCVAFDLSRFEVVNSELIKKPTADIEMQWISSDNSTAETSYSSSIDVHLGDVTGLMEYTSVPYSRNEKPSTDESFVETAMTIGKTHRKYIAKEDTVTYPVLTLSTTTYVSTRQSQLSYSSTDSAWLENTIPSLTDKYAVGSLRLVITQGSYSLTEVKDIDPLEIGALLGSIGGFWELLVLTWGICFIANSRGSEPTMKGRNFSKSLKRGSSIVLRKKRKLGRPSPPAQPEEERPQWDNDNVCISSDSESGEHSGRFHRGSTVRASFGKPVAHPQPKRTRDSSPGGTSSSQHNGPLPRCESLPCSRDAMERGFSRRASDDYTPTRWADIPRASCRSTGTQVASTASVGTRVDSTDAMTTARAPTPPTSIGVIPKVYSGDVAVARSGFFARRSPSAGSLDELALEAEAISEMHGSFNRESIKCQKYGIDRDGGGGKGSNQETMVGRNATTATSSHHWAMPTDSPMSSNGCSSLRGAGFAPTSNSFRDAQV